MKCESIFVLSVQFILQPFSGFSFLLLYYESEELLIVSVIIFKFKQVKIKGKKKNKKTTL